MQWEQLVDPAWFSNPLDGDESGMIVKIDPVKKKNALNKISNFASSTTKTVWRKISKEDFISDLTSMINNPATIDQRQTNLCGIVLSLKLLVEKNSRESC